MTLGDALEGKANALNALRLTFAILVIAAHSWAFTGHPVGLTNLGSWAVAGFFAISGYLIPQARTRTTLATFLTRRARRIYPGFWACLVLTAFVFSPVAARIAGADYDPAMAARYVVVNATTQMRQYLIGSETLGTSATWHEWNGSAWTLIFEITCYLLAGTLLTSSILRRHQAATAGAVLALATASTVYRQSDPDLLWFAAFFAAGWIVARARHRLTVTWLGVSLAAALGFSLGVLVGPTAAALPLAYGVLSAGALLPARWFTTNDISYGTYLYGWPMQQLLLVAGPDRLGVVPFAALSITLALGCGTASWFLLERHCLPRRQAAKVRARHPVQNEAPALAS